jgi:hypothetical protein
MIGEPNAPSSAPSTAAQPETSADTRKIVLDEVGKKWGKFSAQELAALEGKDDLVSQVAGKYASRRLRCSAMSIR